LVTILSAGQSAGLYGNDGKFLPRRPA
jgi:hypothetical protein